jgi:hypothetical protein
LNRIVKLGAAVLSLIGVYAIIVGRPPFYSYFVPDDHSSTPYAPSTTTPGTTDTSSSSTSSPSDSSGSDSGSTETPSSSLDPPVDPTTDESSDTSSSSDSLDSSSSSNNSDADASAGLDVPAISGNSPLDALGDQELYEEQQLPANGEAQAFTSGEAIAPFKIQSQGEGKFLVKLVDASTGDPVMTIFVRGGEDVEASVPLGTYVVKYASGTHWYGYDHLFGDHHTGYSKADETSTLCRMATRSEGSRSRFKRWRAAT